MRLLRDAAAIALAAALNVPLASGQPGPARYRDAVFAEVAVSGPLFRTGAPHTPTAAMPDILRWTSAFLYGALIEKQRRNRTPLGRPAGLSEPGRQTYHRFISPLRVVETPPSAFRLAPHACARPEDHMRQSLPDAKNPSLLRPPSRASWRARAVAPLGAVACLVGVFVACTPSAASAGDLASGEPQSAPASSPVRAAPQAAADPQALLREIAQLKQELEQVRKAYGDRLAALEAQVAAAVAAQVAVVPPPEPAPPAPPAASSKVFNPDVAVIGNLLGTAGTNRVSPSPSIQFKEAEVSFQAAVDPYARADFFVSFGQDEASLEEGYITFPTIPGGLLVRAGQMRTAFGKTNPQHPHTLPWPDKPLVTRNLVGGDDGLADAGVSVARLVPNPWFFLEATGQLYRGDQGNVFHASEASDLNYLARLRAYQDVSESTNADIGASFSMGHNDAGITDGADLGRFTTRLYGVDATVRYKPLRRSIYQSFIGRTELVWSRRQQSDGVQAAFGFYVSGDYQFARRWYAGLRYDRSDRAGEASVLDTGVAAVLTFWPSEFSLVRGMYRRTRYAQSETANELLLQVQFAIGAHGAHPF